MKTTFDLPDVLLRRAKSAAARQGRPLRDLVAEAIDENLAHSAAEAVPRDAVVRGREGWERWKARLEPVPDGSWLNRAGVDDESFFRSLEEARAERWSGHQLLTDGDRDP